MSNEQLPIAHPFPVTSWSLIGRAVDPAHSGQRASMNDVLTRYLPALRTHLIYDKRLPPDQADDLLQNFIAEKIVEHGIVGMAERERGKFRTFLLAALTRYHISQIRKSKAQKRSPGAAQIESIDERHEVASQDRPDQRFEIVWARQIVAEATRRTQAECAQAGRDDVWLLLKARILDPALEGIEPASYEELVKRLGLSSPLQVSNLLVTGRRMYGRNLKSVVAEYARDESEIEEEMRDLRTILASAVESR